MTSPTPRVRGDRGVADAMKRGGESFRPLTCSPARFRRTAASRARRDRQPAPRVLPLAAAVDFLGIDVARRAGATALLRRHAVGKYATTLTAASKTQ